MNHRFIDANVQNFKLIFYALLVGLVVGLLSSAFRFLLAYIEVFRDSLFADTNKTEPTTWLLPVLFALGGVGVALFLVKKFAPETSGSGVHEIEGALDELRPLRWRRVLPVKFIASLFSLGSGLLLGREGPTIQIGANVGKMIKDTFRQTDEENNPLVSAGAAAGLAGAFNAPFSGIIFVIEEMHGHFKFNFFSLTAIMVASASADFVVRALVGANPVIKMMVFPSPGLSTIWLFVVLGALFSFIGYAFNKLLVLSLDFFDDFSKTLMVLSAVIAGILIAIVGIFYPNTISGGYNTISMVLSDSVGLKVLLVLFFGRLLLTIFSYSIGVPGGIFAPLLALGVLMGMLFGGFMQLYFPGLVTNPGVFAVAGMAGIFASTVRAPLTGLMLAVEMTLNFELLLPLIFTSVTAALLTTLIGNQPVYTTLLKRTLSKNIYD